MENLKSFAQKHSSKIGAAVGAIAALVPSVSFAAFGSGMTIPAGTTTNVTTAVNDYFFPTVMATLFQAQMIQIMVVIGTLGLIVWAVKRLYKVFRHPGR